MEILVKGTVFVEVGPQTMALIMGQPRVSTPKEEAKTPKKELPAKEETKKKETAKSSSFADLDDDAKLEAIKAEVTKHTKNKKGADIKWILGQFEAASVSKAEPLDPENYNAFYDAITRYGKGEKLEDIFPNDDLD